MKGFVSSALLLLIALLDTEGAKVAGKLYNEHDPVHIVVNKVGSFNDLTETYRYYSLPFCNQHATEEEELEEAEAENVSLDVLFDGEKSKGALRHKQRLGESIVGDRRETSPYEITFMDSVDWRLLCKTVLEKDDLEKFKDAIHNDYFFEMFVEDLPMWGYIGDVNEEDFSIGEVQGSKTFLFPHLHFFIGYHGNQIVAVKVTTDMDRRVDITDTDRAILVKFSYSVDWYEEPELQWKDRMTQYADPRIVYRAVNATMSFDYAVAGPGLKG